MTSSTSGPSPASEPAGTAPAPVRVREPVPLALAALHLTVVSAFAIAQPLLNLLGKYPAFFAAHESSSLEVLGYALVLLLLPPGVLLLVEFLVGLVSSQARWGLHLVFIAGLASIFALQIVRKVGSLSPHAMFVVALLLGAAAAAVYAKAAPVRSIVSFLGFAPLLFAVLFVFISPVSRIILSGSAKAFKIAPKQEPPVVLLVFDAFPLELLKDGKGTIDAKRYPSFAALARTGTWYRNATTAHENTVFSVPSILDGNVPRKGSHPILTDHPRNLFTLLASRYKINDQEVATNLCPPGNCTHADQPSFFGRLKTLADDTSVVYEYLTLPEPYQDQLPSVGDKWEKFRETDKGSSSKCPTTSTGKPTAAAVLCALRNGQRPSLYLDSVNRIGRLGGGPEFTFIHTLLPHEPRQYLPDGEQYPAGAPRDGSTEGPPSFDNRFLTEQGHARDLLQTGYVDGLVGSTIKRMKEAGLWDKALFIVVSDHGESYRTKATPAPAFVPGKLGYRRAVTPENVGDIAPIPLFVKYPGQTRGRTDDRWVKAFDVLPTVADALGISPLPFKVDGRSLLDRAYRGRDRVEVERTSGPTVSASIPDLVRERDASLAHQTQLFGETWDSLYRYGPHPELVGQPLAGKSIATGDGFTLALRGDEARVFADVDPKGSAVPAQIDGQVKDGEPEGHQIAAALNGRIVATGETFHPIGQYKLSFSLLLPPAALRRGRNDLRIFEIRTDGGLRPVARAG